jgi:uroporphyrinogen-III synthase
MDPMPELSPVVVTRPLAQADQLAASLTAAGRRVEVLPLLQILPLPDAAPLQAELARLSRYRLVAFVSPNAIDAAFAHLAAWPAQVAIAVMGQGSRDALARHGVTAANATIFSPLDPERSDSTTLFAALDAAALRSAPVLIVRGDSGRQFLAEALQAAGAEVTQVAAYRRAAPEFSPELGRRLAELAARSCDWIITSSEALRVLLALIRHIGEPDIVVKMLQQHLIVPHARIAQTARELGFGKITLTASGDEALIAALQ